MATKKPRTNLAKQVSAKASKPSTYAAISGLAGSVAAALMPFSPMGALIATLVGIAAGAVGTFKGVPTEQEAP